MSKLAELIGQASSPISRTPARLREAPVTLSRELRVELEALLHLRDGFVSAGGSLLVRPSVTVAAVRGVDDWNQLTLWRGPYRQTTAEMMFFADNRFGRQFAMVRDEIVAFDPITAQREHLAFGLERFVERVLDEPHWLEGARYEAAGVGELTASQRLLPKIPEGFEGSEGSELAVVEDVELMQRLGRLHKETREHPGVLPAEYEQWWWPEQ